MQTYNLNFTTVEAVRAVPEPTSVLGIVTATGAAAYLKKRGLKQKQAV